MKETIYTIPVNEAFDTEDPCPFCYLLKKLEMEYTDYYLGPSLMEPDHRQDTNKKGFCKKHFEMLYNRQENRLGLALIINTHINEHIGDLKKSYEENRKAINLESQENLTDRLQKKLKRQKSATETYIDRTLEYLNEYHQSCAVCDKETNTMERYIDIVMHLWSTESAFREKFKKRNGFCLVHTELLLNGAKKHLRANKRADFIKHLMNMEILSIEELNDDIDWFTKKFDYRYQNEPWKNSKDAVPRAIEKLKGSSRLK